MVCPAPHRGSSSPPTPLPWDSAVSAAKCAFRRTSGYCLPRDTCSSKAPNPGPGGPSPAGALPLASDPPGPGEARWPVLRPPGTGTGVDQHQAGSWGAPSVGGCPFRPTTLPYLPPAMQGLDPVSPRLPTLPPASPRVCRPRVKWVQRQHLPLTEHQPGEAPPSHSHPVSPAPTSEPPTSHRTLVGGGVSEIWPTAQLPREATSRAPAHPDPFPASARPMACLGTPPHSRAPATPAPGIGVTHRVGRPPGPHAPVQTCCWRTSGGPGNWVSPRLWGQPGTVPRRNSQEGLRKVTLQQVGQEMEPL